MVKKIGFLAACFCFTFLLNAQNEDFVRCSTDEIHAQKMQDPEYAAQFEAKQETVDRYMHEKGGADKLQDGNLVIPVAVHFQGVTIDMACAVQKAQDQIATLNADFAATNADISQWTAAQATFPGISNGASCIQFCLATLNHPAGFGLNDGDFAVTIDQTTGDNDPAWTGYLNFFVRDLAGGTLGYSPLGGNGNGDGITCTTSAFSSVSCGAVPVNAPYDLGRTVTHEVGHYLLLSHPFEGGCADQDFVNDTPATAAASAGCPTLGDVSCTAPILWMSYMDYCDDVCLYMFSQGQVDRMEAYVTNSLTNLTDNAVTMCQELACIDFDVDVDFDDETCGGFDGVIQINAFDGNPPYSYSINNGANYQGSPTFPGLNASTYTIKVIDDEQCEYEEEIELIREAADISVIGLSHAFCGDSAGAITVSVDDLSTFTYTMNGMDWQDSPTFDSLPYGTYTIGAINATGCYGELEVEVEDQNDLTVIIDERNNINCFYGDNGSIKFHVLGADEPVMYTLNESTESEIPLFEQLPEGDHSIHIIDDRGCQETLDFEITRSFLTLDEDCPCQVFVPNAMTPDEDGVNDLLDVVPSCPITNFYMTIYDRWGHKVFETDDINNKWNGAEINDEYYVIDGLYFYKMRYSWGTEYEYTTEEEKMGNIVVLR